MVHIIEKKENKNVFSEAREGWKWLFSKFKKKENNPEEQETEDNLEQNKDHPQAQSEKNIGF
jgi:hypothetical protein